MTLIAAPPPPVASTGPTPGEKNAYVSARPTTLAQARIVNAGRKAYDLYEIASYPNPAPMPDPDIPPTGWNQDAAQHYVEVQALPGGKWANWGILLTADGGVPVTVDVAAGTYEVVADFNDLIRGDADGNVVVGPVTNSNIISGGQRGLILNGVSNEIQGGTGNLILSSGSSVIEGGQGNAIYGGDGNTIPASCSRVALFACTNFTPPSGTTDAEYRNNQLVTAGGGGEQLTVAFNAGSDNTQVFTLATTTTYTQQARTNVATATLNGNPLTVPVTLTAGTTYTLTITRATPANGAALTLSA